MSDIALVWDTDRADFAVEKNDIATDDGLETAVIISLFTDRRASNTDPLPPGHTSRRGCWMDSFPDLEGDEMGSRLWLLAREKEQQTVVQRAEEYAREALAWMIEDKVAARIDVAGEIVERGVLGLSVTIHRPVAGSVRFRYNYTWESQAAKRVA